jgi:hypothetical protein
MINHMLIPLINQFLAKRDKVVRENIGYDQAKHVGVLYSHPDRTKSSAIHELIKALQKDGKTTASLCLLSTRELSASQAENCFGEHEIKLFGRWLNPLVPKFYEQKFDYLLYLDSSVSPLTENILLKSAALCRIGLYNESSKHLFEMMIKTADDSDLSYQMMEVYKYIKQLR